MFTIVTLAKDDRVFEVKRSMKSANSDVGYYDNFSVLAFIFSIFLFLICLSFACVCFCVFAGLCCEIKSIGI